MKHLWKVLIGALVVFIVYLLAANINKTEAQMPGQMICVPMPIAIQKMKELHGEVPIFRGVSKGGYIIILFLNHETGTWTATQIAPPQPNVICAIDAGESGETHLNLLKKEIPNDKSKINW